MRTIIYYFSGTGNNLHIAQKLSGLLENVEVQPIRRLQKLVDSESVKEYGRIIFCVPSYHSHIPNYVEQVISKVRFSKEQQIITIIGCGGNRGHATEDLRQSIVRAGGQVSGEYMVMLPGSYILSYSGFPNGIVGLESSLADRKIRKIAEAIREHRTTVLAKTGFLYKESYEPALQKSISQYAETGKHYTVSDACIGCGTCEKVCPVGNVHLTEGRPVFEDHCQQCMACIQWCPKNALDYNQRAENRRRYHNKAITLKEMMKMNQ